MDLWTFIIIIVLIYTLRDIFKKKFHTSQPYKKRKAVKQEIDDLRQRVYNLENKSSVKKIEKRLQALETIVVDSEYQLCMKFKRELEDKMDEDRYY